MRFLDCVYIHGYSSRQCRLWESWWNGGQSTEKGVGLGRAEHAGVAVVDQSVDWNASFANHAWSILWAAAYQASRSVSASRPTGMVAI